jgi:hypothetical protein
VELSTNTKDNFRNPSGIPAFGNGKGDLSGEGAPIDRRFEINSTIGDSLKNS